MDCLIDYYLKKWNFKFEAVLFFGLALALSMFTTRWARGEMTIEHDPRQTNLNIVDGSNRLYVDIEIPYHEMGDAAKRMIVARSIHFLKQDLAELWTNEKLPKTMEDLTNSAMAIGELQYEKIYQRIREATGDKIRKAVEEALPDSIQRTTDQFAHFDWWRPSGLIVELGAKEHLGFHFLMECRDLLPKLSFLNVFIEFVKYLYRTLKKRDI